MKGLNVKPGSAAPEFTLKDQDGRDISLSSLRGKKVLLSFHPLAWTGVCEIQMRTLELKADAFGSLGTVALGLSVDAVPAKKAWADHMGLSKTRLLSDFWPHGEVAKLYGLFDDLKGISGRANILIDEKGIIAFTRVYELGEVPDIEEIMRVLKGN